MHWPRDACTATPNCTLNCVPHQMSYRRVENGGLHCEAVNLRDLVAEYGTPLYVYSRAAIEDRWRAFDNAFGEREHLVCYAVKAAPNIAILNLIARLGGGFDIVSGGELARVLAAGGEATRTVFSGVGKRGDEIQFALDKGVRCFNVESPDELRRIETLAADAGKKAPVALRVNPDINSPTHAHTATGHKESKFGMPEAQALECAVYANDAKSLDLLGLSVHVGSQIMQLAPLVDGVRRIVELAGELKGRGVEVRSLDCGGGLGIAYSSEGEQAPEPADYARAVLEALGGLGDDYFPLIEPGRSIVGAAGVLLTEVLYIKQAGERRIAIVDAGMNDLMRPVLYGADHEIETLEEARGETATYDIAGPVCENGDYLARGRALSNIAPGAVLAVRDVGAYGFSMANTYNSRPRPAEVLVDGSNAHLIRARDSHADLFAGERVINP